MEGKGRTVPQTGAVRRGGGRARACDGDSADRQGSLVHTRNRGGSRGTFRRRRGGVRRRPADRRAGQVHVDEQRSLPPSAETVRGGAQVLRRGPRFGSRLRGGPERTGDRGGALPCLEDRELR